MHAHNIQLSHLLTDYDLKQIQAVAIAHFLSVHVFNHLYNVIGFACQNPPCTHTQWQRIVSITN